MFRRCVPLLAIISTVAIAVSGCGSSSTPTNPGDTTPPPSNTPTARVVQGTVELGAFQMAVIQFRVTTAGTLTTSVDWARPSTEIESELIAGRCSVDAILADALPCHHTGTEPVRHPKPSTHSLSAQAGDYTLVIKSQGPAVETPAYRIEGYVADETAPAKSPTRKASTFAFTLRGGSASGEHVVVGPVQAGNGPLEVTLEYSGEFKIFACVGTILPCNEFGNEPTVEVFDLPSDLPAGAIRAWVYFNERVSQPRGTAEGTVKFTYNPR